MSGRDDNLSSVEICVLPKTIVHWQPSLQALMVTHTSQKKPPLQKSCKGFKLPLMKTTKKSEIMTHDIERVINGLSDISCGFSLIGLCINVVEAPDGLRMFSALFVFLLSIYSSCYSPSGETKRPFLIYIFKWTHYSPVNQSPNLCGRRWTQEDVSRFFMLASALHSLV